MSEYSNPMPDVPGWDWDENDHSWLAAGAHKDGVSIFFMHGGRVRHQADIRTGNYPLEDFIEMLRTYARGLDAPHVRWTDGGDGDNSLWLEGTRLPNESDLARLDETRAHQEFKDRQDLDYIRKKHPEWFR